MCIRSFIYLFLYSLSSPSSVSSHLSLSLPSLSIYLALSHSLTHTHSLCCLDYWNTCMNMLTSLLVFLFLRIYSLVMHIFKTLFYFCQCYCRRLQHWSLALLHASGSPIFFCFGEEFSLSGDSCSSMWIKLVFKEPLLIFFLLGEGSV